MITVHTKGDYVWTQAKDGTVRAFQVDEKGNLVEIYPAAALIESGRLM